MSSVKTLKENKKFLHPENIIQQEIYHHYQKNAIKN